jgi:hypothetical protein
VSRISKRRVKLTLAWLTLAVAAANLLQALAQLLEEVLRAFSLH